MRTFGLGLMLSFIAAPVFSAQPVDAPINAQVLYLQQVDAAIREGRLNQAEQMIALLQQSGPGVFADDLALLKAELLIARMDVTSAGAVLSTIENLERNRCRLHTARGWVSANQQALDDAIIALAVATKNCPDDASAWNLLGLAFIGKGETSAARTAFEEAMRLEPGNPQVINNHALAALQGGDVEAALRALNDAAAQRPQDSTILANRNFVAGIAGLAPQRLKSESDTDWSAKLLQFAKGAKMASREMQATALFSRALLTLERFDETVWSEINPPNESAPK